MLEEFQALARKVICVCAGAGEGGRGWERTEAGQPAYGPHSAASMLGPMGNSGLRLQSVKWNICFPGNCANER